MVRMTLVSSACAWTIALPSADDLWEYGDDGDDGDDIAAGERQSWPEMDELVVNVHRPALSV